MSWQEACGEIGHMVAKHPTYQPLLQLATHVATTPAATEVHCTYGFSGWMITDSADLHWDDNILFVRYEPQAGQFEFEHRALTGHRDLQRCPEAEGLARLSLFLRYKFGVLLEPTPQA